MLFLWKWLSVGQPTTLGAKSKKKIFFAQNHSIRKKNNKKIFFQIFRFSDFFSPDPGQNGIYGA